MTKIRSIWVIILFVFFLGVTVLYNLRKNKTTDFSGLRYVGEPKFENFNQKDRNHLIHDLKSQLKRIEFLENRALNKEEQSLTLLFSWFFNSDGIIAESITASLTDILEKEPAFFFLNLNKQKKEKQIKIYAIIIDYKKFFDITSLRKTKVCPKVFIDLYNAYSENPKNIEKYLK